MAPLSKDHTGKRFGKLIAISVLEEKSHGKKVWRCLCDCGTFVNVLAGSLVSGGTKSCGCLRGYPSRNAYGAENSTLCMDAEVFKGLQKALELSNISLSDILDMPISVVSAYRTGNRTIPKTVTTLMMLLLIINGGRERFFEWLFESYGKLAFVEIQKVSQEIGYCISDDKIHSSILKLKDQGKIREQLPGIYEQSN